MAKTNSEKWEEYLNGTTPSTEVSKEEGHRRLQEYRAQKAAANPAPVSGDKTAAPMYTGAGRLPDISGNPAAGNLPFQRIGNNLTDTQKAQMVPTIMLDQKQQELEDYKASDAYRTDSEAQAQKDRNQAAAAQASQSDNMGSYLASAIMDLFGTTSAPSTGKTEREKKLEAEIEYYSQKQQEVKDYGIMEKDLAEYRTWDSSDQQLLNRYIQGRVGSWSDIASGISSAMTGGYRSGDAQYNAAQALQTLSEKYGEARVKEIAESVERYQNAQNAQYMESLGRDSATFGGNLMSVGASLGGSITAPIGALQSLTGSTGRFSTLDPNNPGYLPNTFSGAVRGQTKEDIQEAFTGNFAGKAVSAIYESGMSALDNMLRIAVGGEVGSLALAATGSFGQTVQKVSAQGGTPAQALAMGVIDGALEVITEKVSLDNLLSQKNTGWQGFRKAIKDAFIAGGIEVSEEELSFVASTLAEAAVLRDKSSYKQTIAELVAGGMSYEDAKAQADRQLVNEALNTALNSFLSGNMMSGATSTVQGVTNVAENLLDLQGAGDYSSFFTPPNVARNVGPDVQQNTAQETATPTGRPESTATEQFTPSAESTAVGQQTARETAQEAPRNVSRNVEARQEQQTGQTREADMAQAFREAAAELQGVPTPEPQGETAGTATENGPENADTSETGDSADRPGEWSVGAANSGFTGKEAYYELIGEDNYQPDRPGDVRGGEVAKVDPYGRNVTKFAKNAHGAAVTSDAMADAIEDLIMDGALGFDRQTSREALKRAKPAVSKARKESTRNQLIKNVANGVVKDGDIEKAMLLYADYNRSGDIENASEMMVSLSMMANMSGRRLNLFKLLRRMTPEGQLMTVEKTVRSQIDKLNKRRSDKNQIQDISIPQELQEQYLEIAKRSLDNNELVANYAGEQLSVIVDEQSQNSADRVVNDYKNLHNQPETDMTTNDLAERVGERVAESLARTAREQSRSVEDVLYREIMSFANDKARYGAEPSTAEQNRNLDALRDYYRYRPFFQTAWDVARRRVEQTMQTMQESDPRLPVLENFLASGDNVLGIENESRINTIDYANQKSTLRKAVKEAADTVGVRVENRTERQQQTRRQVRDILVENAHNKDMAANQIVQVVMQGMDVSESTANEMAQDIVNAFYSDLADQSARRLASMFGERTLTPKAEKTMSQKLAELFNMGAFSSEQYRSVAFDSVFGEESGIDIPDSMLEQLSNANEEQRKDVEQAIYSFAASQIKATFAEKWNAWRYMCMLGNVRTNVRNLAGNAAYIPYTEAKRAIGTAIEKAFLPKDQRTKSLIGFGENDRAILKWANADAKTTAAEALKYTARLGDDNAKSKIRDSRKIFDTKLLESARKVIEWAPSAGDIIFKNREYSLSLAGFLKARGYTYSDITENKVSESVLYEARNYAIQEAMRATFNDVNAISEFFTNIRAPKNNPIGQAVNLILEGVLPFRKTPANIIARSLENTPFNAFRGGINLLTKVKKGEMTAATAIDQIASGMTGTAAWALGYALASGILPVRLVGYVDDEEEKRCGAQSYALTWTDSEGNDHYVDISWAAPANIPLFVGANLYQIRDGQGMDTSVSKMTGFLYSSMTLFEPMLELSCLSSLNDLVESVRYSNSGDAIYTVLAQAATSYFTQGIPTLLRQADQATQKNEMQTFANSSDPLIRSAQRTAANIPFAGRAFKTEKIDEFGNPVSRGNAGQRVLDAFVSPGKHTVVDNTDVTAEIDRLNELGGSVSPPDIQKTITFTDSEGVRHADQRLTEQEYARLRQLQGQTADTVLNQMISSPDYAALSDAQKEKAFAYAYDYARETARTQAIEGYSGMDGWVEKIEGKEADTIIQKVVIGDLTGAAKSLKSVWADNKDDSSALMDLEDIYQSYTRMEESTRDAVLEEVSGAAQDYIRFRNDGGTAERYSTIYRPYVLADSAVTDARAAFRAGEAVGEDVSEALSQAYERYSGMNFTDKKAFKEIASTVVNGFMEAGAAGMYADTFVDLYRQYYTISNGEGKASEKASSWASVLHRAVENGTIEEKQETIMKNRFKIATGFTVEATRFDAMTDAGLSADKSDYVMELLNGIEPEEGRTNIRDVQYAEQISGSNRLSESEKTAALSAYLSDSQKENLSEMQKLGYDTEDYANAYRIYLDYASGKGKKAATIKHLQSVFGIDYQTAKAIYEIFG